jgi:osmotically-inducible protein OsmY
MKTLLILLLVCAISGAWGWRYYQRTQKPTIGERAAAQAERVRETVAEAREVVADKASEWKLAPEEVARDLAKTGRVVRMRTAAGENTDDTRIVATIKEKFLVESDLSSFEIAVDSRNGEVKLTGEVRSPAQIAQAVGLALQTSGVHRVESQIALRS